MQDLGVTQYKRSIIENFNLGKAFRGAVYIGGVNAVQSIQGLGSKQSKFTIPGQGAADSPLYTGDLGQPVWADFHIEAGNYIDPQGNEKSYPELIIPTVLLTLQQTKNIIETDVQGLDDTIKEYISEGSWMINVKGVLLGSNNSYPQIDVEKLKQILKASGALTINNWYLSNWDIYNLVVTDKNIPQVAGGYSQQPFEFNAKSDTAIELF